MGLRELLILVLILAIVGVIVRGLYVALRARRGQLRMALEKNIPQYDPDEIALSELPNGGARLVERSFAHVVRQNSEFSSRDKIGKSDHAIPVLMDSVGDDDDEDVSPVRTSSVATARNAARQRHSTLGSKTVVTPKPTHRPIDVMPARSAPAAAAAPTPVSMSSVTPAAATFAGNAGEESTKTYADPLDSHVFKDDDLIAYDDREEWQEPEEEDDFDDTPLDDDLDDDFDEDEDDSYSEGLGGEVMDEIDDEVEGEPASDRYEDSFAGEDDGDSDDDYDDELEQDELEHDDFEQDELDDVEAEDDDGEDDEFDDDELEAEEFESVYGEDRDESTTLRASDDFHDDYDDEGDDLDDYPEDYPEEEEAKSGPRRWLQWAGDKISGMTSAAVSRAEREREKDAIERQRSAGRAEPMIGGNSFDDAMMEERRPAAAPTPAPKPSSKPEPLHKSRQSELNLDDSFDDEPFNASDDFDDVSPVRERAVEAPVKTSESTAEKAPARTEKPESASLEYSEVLVLNVVAKPDREFTGVDLLPVLLTTGLRFGDMSIFHRHLDNDVRSPVLFSV
ncbi:MAG: cell division protein ZipA C-terminal FtsZ-binding domain-containing protein, partial [Pseudohongiellaceae bacterium]